MPTVLDSLKETRRVRDIHVLTHKAGEQDWWASFDSLGEFFSWMNETFPGWVYDDKKSGEFTTFYRHADTETEIIVRGV